LVGCRPTPTTLDIPASEHPVLELSIACPTEETAALLRGHTRSWALRKDVKITIRTHDFANEKEQKIKPSTPADVWIIPYAELPRWAAAGQLTPLPESYKAFDNPFAWSDLLPMFREQLVQWDGKTYGLPLVGESPLCCYRADLFQASANQAALRKILGRDLAGPVTWEQFAQLAEYFREKGANGRPGLSLPPLPRADDDLDRLFYTVAVGFARRAVRDDENRRAYQPDDVFSFHYDFKTGQPRIAVPGFIHALKLLQRLQACRPAQPAEHPEDAFRDGQAVLCLTDAPWVKIFQKMAVLRDKVGVCRIPGGDRYFDFQTGQERQPQLGSVNWLPYLGGAGWLAVVSRSSRNSETAFDLLADLAGTKTSMQIFLGATGEGGPTRTGQLYRHRWDSFDLDDKRATHLREIMEETLQHRNLKNAVLCLRTPRQAEHRAVLVRGLRQALFEGADAEKTLRNVAEAWRKLDQEQGPEQHRADYRLSLGLLAKE
jgi:multiple sugar transport system substrate-binding protein